jgi:hypothetical protein
MASTVCLASEFDVKLSADVVCSKDSIKLLAPSVVASGRLGVLEAFLEADTLVAVLQEEVTFVPSDLGEVNIDLDETEGGEDIEAELFKLAS